MKQTFTESFFWKWYQAAQNPKVFWPIMGLAFFVIVFHYFFSIGINFSNSAPERFFIFEKYADTKTLERGDYIQFAYGNDKFFPRGATFVKKIGGMPGDRITYIGNDVYVNGQYMGMAKLFSGPEQDGAPLEMNTKTEIPEGYFYVYGSTTDSFDSRYSYVGLLHESLIKGKSIIEFGSGHEDVGEHETNTGTLVFFKELVSKVFS